MNHLQLSVEFTLRGAVLSARRRPLGVKPHPLTNLPFHVAGSSLYEHYPQELRIGGNESRLRVYDVVPPR